MNSRERFEAWASEYGFAYELIDVHDWAKNCAWDAWQAARRQALEQALCIVGENDVVTAIRKIRALMQQDES
jgi:hypothetical protein